MQANLEVPIGEVFAGKYRIDRVLGQGGMGVVVGATHLQLEERVAIKFLLPSALDNKEAVARFAREARAAVRIKSEHVARVTDVGTLPNGCPYMVMEYLDGQDLAHLIAERGPLPVDEAVDYVLQGAEAIAEAHSLGIIHRDLKPANLFRIRRADGSACIKVLDFGISKVTGLSGSGANLDMTRTTAIMGSPLYMSPEQMSSSRDVDVRTDIWALGVILYELLSGRVPFNADTMPQLCAMILQHPAPPLRNVRPDTPETLQSVLLRTMEKDPRARQTNMAEFANALLPFASRSGRNSVERISRVLSGGEAAISNARGPSSRPPAAANTQAAWGQTSSSPKRRASWIVLGVSLIGAAAAAGVWALNSESHSQPTAPTAVINAKAPVTPQPEVSAAPKAVPPTTAAPTTVVSAPVAAAGPAQPTANVATPAPVRTAARPQGKRPPAGKAQPSSAPTPATASPRPKPLDDLYSNRK